MEVSIVTMNMSSWEMLSTKVRKIISKYGYTSLTPIQEKAIPYIISEFNTLIIAPTGSGKTEAALFPIFTLMEKHSLKGISLLYITPLRALNRDILRRMSYIARDLGYNIAVRHGDTSVSERRKIQENPPHILITTPETLQFILTNRAIRRALKSLKWVVVDELHELLNDERGSELAVALERLECRSRFKIQRIGLSATIGDEEEAKMFLGGVGRRVYIVKVEIPKKFNVTVETPKTTDEDEVIAQSLNVNVESIARARRIIEITKNSKGTIIFTNTRDTAELLSSRIKSLGFEEFKVHHGSLSKHERLEAEDKFKSKDLKAVISTSSLELGIDIGHVDIVVQYMSPRQALRLLQRVGRSGHLLHEVSRGIIITDGSPDDILESLTIARRVISNDLEKQKAHRKPLDVLTHQIIGLTIECEGRANIWHIYDVIKRSLPFSDLDKDEFIRLIDYLCSVGLIRRISEDVIGLGRGSIKYYYETSMIPDTTEYKVIDLTCNKVIGSLDEDFVMSYCDVGFKFILSGRVWSVVDVNHEDLKVHVEPSNDIIGAIPAWLGELIPVDYKVTREATSIIRRIINDVDPLDKYPVDENSKQIIRKIVEDLLRRNIPIPHDKRVVVEHLNSSKITILHIPLGSKGNLALSYILSSLLSRKLQCAVSVSSSPYRIVLYSAKPIPVGLINDLLKLIPTYDLHSVLRNSLINSRVFRWRVTIVARKFGVLSKESKVGLYSRVIDSLIETPVGEEAYRELLHEKLDVKPVIEYTNMIRKGLIEVIEIHCKTPTPLAEQTLKQAITRDYNVAGVPTTLVVELVKRRLSSKVVKLVCLMCGKWSKIEVIGKLPDRVKCKVCNSAFLAPTRPDDTLLENAVRKYYRREKLTAEEKDVLKKARLKADLVLTFGKPAIIALSAYGIGVSKAPKIVSMYSRGEEAFYTAIFNAEKEYIRTRRYWD